MKETDEKEPVKRGRKSYIENEALKPLIKAAKSFEQRQKWRKREKIPEKKPGTIVVFSPVKILTETTRENNKKFSRSQAVTALERLKEQGRIEIVLREHFISEPQKPAGDEIEYAVLKLEPEKPKTEKPAETKPGKSELTAIESEKIESRFIGDVAIFVDYENFARALGNRCKSQIEPPIEILKEIGKRHGPVLPVRIYGPLYLLTPEKVAELRQKGYRPIPCPPNKPGGKDSVDDTMKEDIKTSNAATVILISNDSDFNEIADYEKGRRNFVRVTVDENKNLRIDNDEVVALKPSKPIIKAAIAEPAQNSVTENGGNGSNGSEKDERIEDFLGVIRAAAKRERFAAEDKRLNLVKATLEWLKSMAPLLEKPEYRRGMKGLKYLVWQGIYPAVSQVFSQDDCEAVLVAFIATGIISKRFQSTEPRTYYVYNTNRLLVL